MAAAVCAFALLAPMPALAVNTNLGAQVVSADPADWTPHVMDGSVNGIVQLGSKMYAVGTFTTVRQRVAGPDITRNGIFAFDAVTGEIDPTFDPNLGGSANSIDTDGTSIFIGGDFSSVGGKTAHRKVAMLDPTTGKVVRKIVSANASVNEVVVRDTRLFIGGRFTVVGGETRNGFAAINTADGTLDPNANVAFTGQYNGGGTSIVRMDVTPDGSKVVAVGNFTAVGGQPRQQIAVVDTPSAAPATVNTWATNRFDRDRNSCARVFETFMRDVDIDPTGSYFVATTTGAFAGGANSGTMCDSTQRWALSEGSGQQPAWVNYTGGDTTYGVAVAGDVVYLGGHFRWQDNPYQGDQAGPGAVAREGIAAIDAVNGLPIAWNPGRTRGVGAQAMYVTPQGLWVGSDTNQIGGELHSRVAFLPLAGDTVPTVTQTPLPTTIFTGAAANAGVRLNTGSSTVTDPSGNWSAAGANVSGGSVSNRSGSVSYTSSMPSSTPTNLFKTERAGNQNWSIPVPAGQSVKLRLYFAEQGLLVVPGTRVFNVAVDGQTRLSNYDIYNAAGGTRRAVMVELPVTSDGIVNLSLTSVRSSALINAVEIVDDSPSPLTKRELDAAGVPITAPATADTSINWAQVRAATAVNDTLYYGLPDGKFYARDFDDDAATFGAQRQVDLNNDPDNGAVIPFNIAGLSGLAYDATMHRLYYTIEGDAKLYYRGFTLSGEKVGSLTFTAPDAGINFATTRGLAIAEGTMLYGSTDGTLRSVPFANGVVAGPATVLSTDGTWNSRVMFLDPDGPPPPNVEPSAEFSTSCDSAGLCTFDATQSNDPDGSITSYEWDFGDGNTGSGATVTHTYAADGCYPVTLTITDNSNATASASGTAVVELAQETAAAFRASASAQSTSNRVALTVPAEIQAGDLLVLNLTQNSATATTLANDGWTQVGSVASTGGDLRSTTWSRVADGTEVGTSLTVNLAAASKTALDLVAYSGVASSDPVVSWAGQAETAVGAEHTTPPAVDAAGGWVISFWADKTNATTDWTEPADQTVRAETITPSAGRVTTLLTDTNGPKVGAQPGQTATANSATAKAVMWTMVIT